jgi:H+/Cl- antiporter ClcA
MKKVGIIILFVAFAIFAVVDTIHDFRTNDPIQYFSQQPLRLLLVAAIAIAGGLLAYVFFRLSPFWQRRMKLLALGLAASFLVAFTGYMFYVLARCLSFFGIANSPLYFIIMPVCFGIIDTLLWYEFYRVYKKRVI